MGAARCTTILVHTPWYLRGLTSCSVSSHLVVGVLIETTCVIVLSLFLAFHDCLREQSHCLRSQVTGKHTRVSDHSTKSKQQLVCSGGTLNEDTPGGVRQTPHHTQHCLASTAQPSSSSTSESCEADTTTTTTAVTTHSQLLSLLAHRAHATHNSLHALHTDDIIHQSDECIAAKQVFAAKRRE